MKLFGQFLLLVLLAGLVSLGVAVFSNALTARVKAAEVQVSAAQRKVAALEQRLAQATAMESVERFPEDLVWRAPSRSNAELQFQDAATGVLDTAGIQSRTFGNAQFDAGTTREAIAFEFEAVTRLPNLLNLLEQLEAHTPKLAVGSLQIRRSGHSQSDRSEVHVSVRATLWAFWEEATQ